MKTQTKIDYAKRIDRVVDRVAQAIGEEDVPSADVLAGVAALSPFHFHRVFRLMTGESLSAMTRRVRLARSLATLRDASASVTDASGTAGYATSQAYARAIRMVTGASATEMRDTPQALDAVAQQLASASGIASSPLTIEIVSASPLRLHVLRNVGAYGELNGGYGRLFESVFANLPINTLIGVHGLFDDDPRSVAADVFRFTCGVELPTDVDTVVTTLDIEGGQYIRARHVGDYGSLLDAIDGVTAVAVSVGLTLEDAPVRIHYIDTPDEAPVEDLRSDIYLPLAAPPRRFPSS